MWDAVEVVELTRKHTAGVGSVLTDIRRSIDSLVRRRNERRDGFVKVMAKAMKEKLGDDAESVLKELVKNGIPRQLAKDALDIAQQQGRVTIFSLVDAMTTLAGRVMNAGDRLEIDAKAAQLLAMAAGILPCYETPNRPQTEVWGSLRGWQFRGPVSNSPSARQKSFSRRSTRQRDARE